MSMFVGSIGFGFLSAAGVAASFPLFALASTAGGGVSWAGGFADLSTPTGGVFPERGDFCGSVCACKANAINKLKSETKSDFFIRQTNPIRSSLSSNVTVRLLTELTKCRKRLQTIRMLRNHLF